ncbi:MULTISPECIES: hypothetical protein [Mammaliicoccus]|uniref:Uncharacterized protein n=1 Tax=Mammaliicoccus vitulinus TaxID=71237 RepID=A0ABX7HEV9_9STAP|nr:MULTISPECIES: hypothetical protein [Mammaliicoccus]MBO3076716.1 hypothetical protein [Mammaliicoccus vitulinus]MEB7779239.1 hypothetical protein [Mammaliicoccus fleurettii]PNZ40925.1 hypothetical protein CD107_00970 [Mammaliicoccus vitulinus]QRO85150.1 hypothetical protein I6J37_00130 [Mammaliicoccus vitulinus]
MKAYKVVTETPMTYRKTYYIEAHDEEDIRNQLDIRMKANPLDFTDTQDYKIGEYELEEIDIR